MNLKNIFKHQKENNSQYVYRILKENIINLNLKPGELVSETLVSNFLHLSRTPIREAFIQLNQEGLIKSTPQKKSMITKLDMNLIKESVFMRSILEKEILKKVIKKEDLSSLIKELDNNLHFQKKVVLSQENFHDLFYLDNEFHKSIFNSVEFINVWDILVIFNIHHSRLRLLEVLEKKNYDSIVIDHQILIDLISNRDAKALEIFPNNHLSKYLETYKNLQTKYPQYFKKN